MRLHTYSVGECSNLLYLF